MQVKPAQPSQGFDLNTPLTPASAVAFKAAGMAFVIRYVPRTATLIGTSNLTEQEIEIILTAGLALMAVQHVSPDNWWPTAALGESYGQYGAEYADQIGYPKGGMLWLDLEMVNKDALPADIIAYCKAWFEAVSSAGYVPGLYVGWQTGLTPQQLYDLPFTAYWRGYNADIGIPGRGYCMLQAPQKTLDSIIYDPDELVADKEGVLPVWVTA